MDQTTYSDKVDILVKYLKEYLVSELKTDTKQYKLLLVEKEGWVEAQIAEWLDKKVKETYGWSAREVWSVDVMAILTCQIVRYLGAGGDPVTDFLLSSQTTVESINNS
jgi:hypothetical protein